MSAPLYAGLGAATLSILKSFGSRVTFEKTGLGLEQPDGSFVGEVISSVSGWMVDTEEGDSETYKELGLLQMEAPRTLFTAETYGAIPDVGSRVTWGGYSWEARAVKPYRGSGTSLFCFIILSK